MPQSAPAIANLTPAAGTAIPWNQVIEFDLTDDSGKFRRVMLVAKLVTAKIQEVIHDGDSFGPRYQLDSNARTQLVSGYHFKVLRDGGWTESPTITIFPIDLTAADHLSFTTQPAGLVVGGPFGSTVVVKVLDKAGAVCTSPAFDIALTINKGTLTGTTTRTTVSGIATFTGLGMATDVPTSNYYITATASGNPINIASQDSALFSTTAPQLVFTQQPTNCSSGVPISPTITVAVRNGANTLTDYPATAITLTPSQGSIFGTSPVNTSSGVATFTGVGMGATGTAITLSASGPGVLTGVSSAFNCLASYLRFTTQPVNANCQPSTAAAIVVTCYDKNGNVATGYTGTVTLAVAMANGGGTSVSSGATAAAVAGVATFSGTKYLHQGASIWLLATGTNGPLAALSGSFNTTPGAATTTNWIGVGPGPVTSNMPYSSDVAVEVLDDNGNRVTTSGDSIRYGEDNGAGGYVGDGTLIHDNYDPGGGIIRWLQTAVPETNTGLNLRIIARPNSNNGAPEKISGVFQVSHAAGIAVPFLGTEYCPGDPYGTINARLVNSDGTLNSTDNTTSITVSGTYVSGTLTRTCVNGIAAFTGLTVPASANDATELRLTFTGSGGQSGQSGAYNVYKPQLQFDAQPSDMASGGTFNPVIIVSARKKDGTKYLTSAVAVTIAIQSGSTLGGTVTQNTSSGIATFTAVTGSGAAGSIVVTAAGTLYSAAVAAKNATSNGFKLT